MNFTKNSNTIKLKPFFRFWQNFYNNAANILSTNMKNYLAQNFNLVELASKMPCFRKIQNFIKSERSDGFSSNLIPNVLEH